MNIRVATSPFYMLRELDRSIILGAVISFSLLAVGVLSSGKVLNFVDVPSLLLVLGGTIGATFIHYSLSDLRSSWDVLCRALREQEFNISERIRYLVRLAQSIRISGVLVLEEEAQRSRDSFVRIALELVADGRSPDDMRRILDIEMRTSQDKSVRAAKVFETMGTYAPALGLIGTLIGLIQMLGALEDPHTVGPAMSLALITTLYGAVLANLIFLPIAGKISRRHEQEVLLKCLTIEGAIGLAGQESAVMLEQRLISFLPEEQA